MQSDETVTPLSRGSHRHADPAALPSHGAPPSMESWWLWPETGPDLGSCGQLAVQRQVQRYVRGVDCRAARLRRLPCAGRGERRPRRFDAALLVLWATALTPPTPLRTCPCRCAGSGGRRGKGGTRAACRTAASADGRSSTVPTALAAPDDDGANPLCRPSGYGVATMRNVTAPAVVMPEPWRRQQVAIRVLTLTSAPDRVLALVSEATGCEQRFLSTWRDDGRRLVRMPSTAPIRARSRRVRPWCRRPGCG